MFEILESSSKSLFPSFAKLLVECFFVKKFLVFFPLLSVYLSKIEISFVFISFTIGKKYSITSLNIFNILNLYNKNCLSVTGRFIS